MARLLAVFFISLFSTAVAAVGESDISDAYYASDVDRLEQLRGDLDEDAYLAAYLDWRLGSLLFGRGDLEAADKVWLRAQSTLEKLTAVDGGLWNAIDAWVVTHPDTARIMSEPATRESRVSRAGIAKA